MMLLGRSLWFLGVLTLGVSAEKCPISAPPGFTEATLMPDRAYLFYKREGDTINMIPCCKTTGWCGIGVSPVTHDMRNSDGAIAWQIGERGEAKSVYVEDTRVKPQLSSDTVWNLHQFDAKDGWVRPWYKRPMEAPASVSTAKSFKVGSNTIIWSFKNGPLMTYANVIMHDVQGITSIRIHTDTGSVGVAWLSNTAMLVFALMVSSVVTSYCL